MPISSELGTVPATCGRRIFPSRKPCRQKQNISLTASTLVLLPSPTGPLACRWSRYWKRHHVPLPNRAIRYLCYTSTSSARTCDFAIHDDLPLSKDVGPTGVSLL